MHYYYADDCGSDIITLDADESRHCVRVMRMSEGDEITVVDGNGMLCLCHIAEANAKGCVIAVQHRQQQERCRPSIHLAVAPTKNPARMEWLTEKAVELGIATFTPIECMHSERHTLKSERLKKIMVSAMKQSLKSYVPHLDEPTPVTTLIKTPFDGQRFIAYCNGDQRTPLRDVYMPGSNAQILIGPEGDFSLQEIESALSAGFQPVTLGNSRLRTETAAIAAVALLNLLN